MLIKNIICNRIHIKNILEQNNLRPKLVRYSSKLQKENNENISIGGKDFVCDHMTNVTPKILSLVGRNFHLEKQHPLGQLHKRIVQFMYKQYQTPRGNPLFSVHDRLFPVVTTHQNFDSLLVPKDHACRQRNDNYYINKDLLLRAHTTSHQAEMIEAGLNNFLIVGDVYRRDTVDSSHYPVFHQADAVRLFNKQDIFGRGTTVDVARPLEEKEGEREETERSQGCHSDSVVQFVARDLKRCLVSLVHSLFGEGVECRWVSAFFPFTHPSWELEIKVENKWVEILGCGVIRQEILNNAGACEKVGWAFGLGLERLAMKLYAIPDIRIFWSEDPRFGAQFDFEDPNTDVTYKPFSRQPACVNDLSFWLPTDRPFSSEDFYDLVRSVGQDLVEQVSLIDVFRHPTMALTSHCYRVTYRSWERTLTNAQVNVVHERLGRAAKDIFGVTLRWTSPQ